MHTLKLSERDVTHWGKNEVKGPESLDMGSRHAPTMCSIMGVSAQSAHASKGESYDAIALAGS
jgi:hypothetical protein